MPTDLNNRTEQILFITGSQDIKDKFILLKAFEISGYSETGITKIIHGGAKGVDQSANWLATHIKVEVEVFRPVITDAMAFWEIKKAYLDRNTVMAELCDFSIAVWNGQSPGTEDAIKKVKKLGKPYHWFCCQNSELKLFSTHQIGLF